MVWAFARARPSSFLIAVLVVSCGDPAPVPPATPPTASSAPSATAISAIDASAAPVLTVNGDPTVRTPEQRARDEKLAPIAASIVDAYPNWNGFFSPLVANFSPDGKSFVFGSLRDGAPELYLGEVAHPDAPPKPLTLGPDRALWGDFLPDGHALLFLRDEKGDENASIWRVRIDGTALENLTPGEKLRRDEPAVTRDGKSMIYPARSTGSAGTRFYEQALAPNATARVVYEEPLLVQLTDVSPDRKHIVFSRILAKNDEELVDLDVASGKTRAVFPPRGSKMSFHGGRHSADGKKFFLSTDEGKESAVLLAIDLASGKVLARYADPSPSAQLSLEVAPKGDRIALGVDHGNHGALRILDAKTLAVVHDVTVPLGEIGLGPFSRDGRMLAIRISLPTQPADLFAVDVTSAEVKPLRTEKRPGMDSLPPIDATLATIPAHDGLSLPVNVYRPRGEGDRKRPVIAIFHGGPQVSYQVRWSLYARFFVSLGYVVLEPNVRGSAGFGRAYEMADDREKRADWLEDLASVNRWARAQSWCDPDRIVVWGQSYGGYTTLMAMTRQPTVWRAGVDLYGISDLRTLFRTTSATGRVALAQEFGDPEKDAALVEAWSPMRDVSAIARPLFVYAGRNDSRVPQSESDAIVRALRVRGVPVEYMLADNEGHGVDHRETKIELMTRTARFLEDALR